MNGYICPDCGEDMQLWHMGIYECKDCDVMIDSDIFEGEDNE
jgi:ribosomal protein L37AE/L43A